MTGAAEGPDTAAGDADADRSARRAAARTERETARAADRITRFLADRTDPVVAVEHLGGAARVVLAAAGTGFGDVVVRSVAIAQDACRRAGVTPVAWDRDTAGRVQLTPEQRVRMAGTGR